jgi:hypothetical protein
MSVCYYVPCGISSALSILCGNALGANQPTEAKAVSKMVLGAGTLFAVLECTVVYGYRWEIARLVTDDAEVMQILMQDGAVLMPPLLSAGGGGCSGGHECGDALLLLGPDHDHPHCSHHCLWYGLLLICC